jgi:hypothetical protein
MKHEGPALETLLRRLADTPRDFLDPPLPAKDGVLDVHALIFDLSRQTGEACTVQELRALPVKPDFLTLCAIACWLLGDECLRDSVDKRKLLSFLGETVRALAKECRAERYILDPERREELARIALASLSLRPAGETKAQAQDRLQALSGIERRRIIAATREAEKRAREIREALIQKAAAEAADKYTRE